MAKWWEIESAINDALSNVDDARSGVCDFYPPDSPDYKNPALDELLANLDRLTEQLKTVFPEAIKRAIHDEALADDEAEARADAASY